jgi:hypothetical protein
MTYENNIPGDTRITLHNSEGTAAIGCFWLIRDSKRVMKHVTPDVAVVGNNYHDRFNVKPYDLTLCAHKVARALWNNPQIVELRMISSDREEIDQFVKSLVLHEGLLQTVEYTDFGAKLVLGHDREKIDYPMPPVVEPDSYPYKYPTGHFARGTNLTDLHCDVLRHVRRFGEKTPGEESRQEVMGLYAEWRAPFDLGPAFEPLKDAFEAYSCLLPEPVDLVAGEEGELAEEYTYFDRLTRPWIRYRGEFTRSNWMPVWIPGDELKKEPPCLVGVYVSRKVAYGIFRAHDLVNAWPKNFYLVKRTGERQSGETLDAVVLLSLQGGIRPENQEKARAQIEKYRPEGRPDIHSRGGVWGFCLDGDVGIAQLSGPKGILQEFRGKSEEEVRNNITAMGAWPAEGSECGYIGGRICELFAKGSA